MLKELLSMASAMALIFSTALVFYQLRESMRYRLGFGYGPWMDFNIFITFSALVVTEGLVFIRLGA